MTSYFGSPFLSRGTYHRMPGFPCPRISNTGWDTLIPEGAVEISGVHHVDTFDSCLPHFQDLPRIASATICFKLSRCQSVLRTSISVPCGNTVSSSLMMTERWFWGLDRIWLILVGIDWLVDVILSSCWIPYASICVEVLLTGTEISNYMIF